MKFLNKIFSLGNKNGVLNAHIIVQIGLIVEMYFFERLKKKSLFVLDWIKLIWHNFLGYFVVAIDIPT